MKTILSVCLVFLLFGCSTEVAPPSSKVSPLQGDETRTAEMVPSSNKTSPSQGDENSTAGKVPSSNITSLSQFDEARAAKVAQQALTDWIAENPEEAGQIQGAVLQGVEAKGDLIHVVLVHDNRQYDRQGDGAFHLAHFNVYLDLDYRVDHVERGPDIIE